MRVRMFAVLRKVASSLHSSRHCQIATRNRSLRCGETVAAHVAAAKELLSLHPPPTGQVGMADLADEPAPVAAPPRADEATSSDEADFEALADNVRAAIFSPSTTQLHTIESTLCSFLTRRGAPVTWFPRLNKTHACTASSGHAGHELTEKEVKTVIVLLAQSLPRYALARAKHAVQAALAALLRSSDKATAIFISALPRLATAHTLKDKGCDCCRSMGPMTRLMQCSPAGRRRRRPRCALRCSAGLWCRFAA